MEGSGAYFGNKKTYLSRHLKFQFFSIFFVDDPDDDPNSYCRQDGHNKYELSALPRWRGGLYFEGPTSFLSVQGQGETLFVLRIIGRARSYSFGKLRCVLALGAFAVGPLAVFATSIAGLFATEQIAHQLYLLAWPAIHPPVATVVDLDATVFVLVAHIPLAKI